MIVVFCENLLTRLQNDETGKSVLIAFIWPGSETRIQKDYKNEKELKATKQCIHC